MDLTRQPPRKPSNPVMAGIVGLARMTDKARGHNEATIGDFKYGEMSGLDREILAFVNMSAEEFAEAVERLGDEELASHVLGKAGKSQEQISEFNRSQLEKEPEDELHVKLLNERVEKYAPDCKDIRTVFASIELDDWGCFRDLDITSAPPRSPYVRDVFGVIGGARMADKARAVTASKLGDYNYGVNSGFDRQILAFLVQPADTFREAAYANPNDAELSEWLAQRCSKSQTEISIFNGRMVTRGRYGEARARLEMRRAELAPERPDIQTFCDLQDYDDEKCFGLTDLRRRPPRSVYDDGVGGLAGLARMIDKGRALIGNTLGDYWYGQDSGFDCATLEFIGLAADEFTEGLRDHATDEAVLDWLGERLAGKSVKEKAQFNLSLWTYGPQNDRSREFLERAVANLDPSRKDTETFASLTALDDNVSFARMKAGV